MNLKVKQFKKRHAFTIIELLTVMSIIVILFGLLVPAMNLVRGYGKTVKQQAQFHAIEAGLQMYHDDFQGYPTSDAMNRDNDGNPIASNEDYPGALKLAEALLGQDLLGFNPNSVFNILGKNNNMADPSLYDDGKTLYPPIPANTTDQKLLNNMRLRKGPYIDVTRVTTAGIADLYSGQITTPKQILAICDEFPRVRLKSTGKRVGLPVLYYKANISSLRNPDPNGGTIPTNPADSTYIYNHLDNQKWIIDLVPAWTSPTDTTTFNPIANGKNPGPVGFYEQIRNLKISSPPRPYNQDSFILMSAGIDGLYGTRDDVFNFSKD